MGDIESAVSNIRFSYESYKDEIEIVYIYYNSFVGIKREDECYTYKY